MQNLDGKCSDCNILFLASGRLLAEGCHPSSIKIEKILCLTWNCWCWIETKTSSLENEMRHPVNRQIMFHCESQRSLLPTEKRSWSLLFPFHLRMTSPQTGESLGRWFEKKTFFEICLSGVRKSCLWQIIISSPNLTFFGQLRPLLQGGWSFALSCLCNLHSIIFYFSKFDRSMVAYGH